ncbi:cyclin-SDS isoform X2 [Punica granatum]|uniref:Cyclin-SDS isoform X2 n=1 Tax=Punica granatum TaxID=22663 RepID=A0A218WDD7_PUNGR|nr:cyclin-SDS isoform X2 [Punica granatum]OWM70489.1 hypothetical protein CDL15_Pgr011965 [Punica granatum]
MSSLSDQSQQLFDYRRKLRSKLPQRKRCRWQLSPPLPSLSLDSTVSREMNDDVKKLRRSTQLWNRPHDEAGASEVTEVSSSSSSWCGSSSSALKWPEKRISEHKHPKVSGETEASESVARSEVSSVHQQHSPTKSGEFSSKLCQKIPENVEENRRISVEFKENDVVSITSAVGFCHETGAASSFAELQEERTKREEDRASETESSFRASTVDQKPKSVSLKYDSDLTCTEQLTYDDVPDYSSSYVESFSDLQSEIFLDTSDYEFSGSPSLSFDSGSQFSEKSTEDSTPSYTFALLLQYREQFSRSSAGALPVGKATSAIISEDKVMSFGFDDEDAVSYLMLRNRERRQVILWNYDDEYSECVIDQRSRMVHWMIEKSRLAKLHKETLFLAVSIFDRFLRVGCFKSQRNFQIAGIASLTLATRIEENQPYNSVRQMVFSVGSNVYGRCEVVAMEWLIQEALSFQCSSPTVHNFLWFYLKAERADHQLNKRVKDLGEVALLDHELLCFWPSTIAASLVILACCEDAAAAQRVISTHVRTQDDDLTKCIEVQ